MTPVLRSYIGTALWSSTLEDGSPMDGDYSETDLAPETLAKMKDDLDKFFIAIEILDPPRGNDLPEFLGIPDTQFAHDFWLTRNHHGAGFWDGDYPEPYGKWLTRIAQSFRECELYIGDDGKIYAQ